MPILQGPYSGAQSPYPPRPILRAILRGLRNHCPACGAGYVFSRYLKVVPRCPSCAEPLHHHRADDAPPYFAIVILGHILVPGIIAMEVGFQPAWWVHALFLAPATLLGTYLLLPRVKAATVGLQWALHMHGFGDAADDE